MRFTGYLKLKKKKTHSIDQFASIDIEIHSNNIQMLYTL